MSMYKYLFNENLSPHKKCIGLESALLFSGIAAAGASVVGAGINAYSNASANAQKGAKFYELNEYNLGVMREQQRWQEWRENLAFERQHQLQNEAYAENQRLIDEQRKYDSPSAMVQRAAAAGLNPSAVLGTSAGQQGSGASFGVPGTPQVSGSSASVPSAQGASIPDYQPVFGADTLSGISSLVDTISKFKANFSQGEETFRGLSSVIRSKELQVIENEMDIAYKGIQNNIAKNTGLRKALTDIDLAYSQAVYYTAMGQNYDPDGFVQTVNNLVKLSERELNVEKANNVRAMTSQILMMMPAALEVVKQQANNLRADTADKYASAGLKKVQTTVENLQSQLLQKENAIKSQTFQIDLDNAFTAAIKEGVLSEEQIERGKFLLESARAANSLPDMAKKTRWFLEWLSSTVGAGLGAAAGGFVGSRLKLPKGSKSGAGFTPYSSPNYTYGE